MKFENPYNFVPAIPRDTTHAGLGDAAPGKDLGHDKYRKDRWSGRISVKLTTVTPLLIPELLSVDNNGHKTFGVRKDETGSPYLSPTSIKGVLRSAYEAVTNSRMGVFSNHEDRLALRMSTADARGLIPCTVLRGGQSEDGTTRLKVRLFPGHTEIGAHGMPASPGAPLYAAWLSRYQSHAPKRRDKGEASVALRYPDGSLPKHRDRVWVKLTDPTIHGDGNRKLSVRKVTHIVRYEEGISPQSGFEEGRVFVSGPNIRNKHDERVFLVKNSITLASEIPLHVREGWRTLLENYNEIHRKDIDQRKQRGVTERDYLGDEPGLTAFSYHISEDRLLTGGADAYALKGGELCYAKVRLCDGATKASPETIELLGLYPVQISRDLFECSPDQILDSSLKQVDSLAQLSPADRLFGWVKQGGKGQYKGSLRVGSVSCLGGNGAVESVGAAAGVPLVILGAPKPAQSRFYAAQNPKGEPLQRKISKKKSYAIDHGLRGRKVYVAGRHSESPNYWDWNPETARKPLPSKVGGNLEAFREWIHPATGTDSRTDQNRSVLEWVKPETEFIFDLHVQDISGTELGALLYLLSQPDECRFRFGSAKPLGFGSSKLSIASLSLRDGEALRSSYRNFTSESQGSRSISETASPLVNTLIDTYKKALCKSFADTKKEGAESFDSLPIVRAFVNSLRPSNLPVHYPRTSVMPNVEGKNFEWFVENERAANGSLAHGLSLPFLSLPDRSLPILMKDDSKHSNSPRGIR